jgi:hypothetical protein
MPRGLPSRELRARLPRTVDNEGLTLILVTMRERLEDGGGARAEPLVFARPHGGLTRGMMRVGCDSVSFKER